MASRTRSTGPPIFGIGGSSPIPGRKLDTFGIAYYYLGFSDDFKNVVAVIEGYGLSEASPVLTFNPTERAKIGSIGVPLPSTELKCVDDQGGVVAIGEPGELIARGPQVIPGYWRQPGETENVLRDGWLYTGDIAKMDADGYFSIVDRRKDMILVSGFNVYPNEVETVLAGLRA